MKRTIKKAAAPVLCGLFTFLLFKFVLFIGYVPSASMEPAIAAESYVFGCRFIGQPRRGDVIVFSHNGAVLIKRIAAVPGDVVYIDDTGPTVLVNEELPSGTRVLTIPDDCYFMLGDNSGHSYDSRHWQNPYVTRTQFIAKAWLRPAAPP